MRREIIMKQIGMIILLMLSVSAWAQNLQNDTTLNRTMIVEQEYNPDILDASKINVLPKVEEPAITKKEIEYSTVPIPATSFGFYNEIKPFNEPEKQTDNKGGYIRLGYGNYGNLDARLSYLFHLSKKDRLGVLAGMQGMKGKYKISEVEDKLHYYRSAAKIDYLHQFNRVDMNIAGGWALTNFNYNFLAPMSHQRFTSGEIHLGVKSTDELLPVKFDVETNWFLYSRAHNWSESTFGKVRENRVCTKARISGDISEEHLIGLQFEMDNLFYSKGFWTDYTSLQLNPYYSLDNEDWRLHIGANIDFSLGFGKILQVSPDVNIQYVFNESYVLYTQATGGRILNDFRRVGQFCPYAEILRGQKIADTYEQINASLGFTASPYPGIWFKLYGGYQNLKDELYQITENARGDHSSVLLTLAQEKGSNTYGGASLTYSFKDYVKLSAEGIYRHWDMGDEALVFKPTFQLEVELDVRPIKALAVNLGYKYVQRAKTREQEFNFRIDPVNNLYAGVSYDIYKGFSAYVEMDNILNRQYSYYYNYPAEKLNFLAGISYRF